jgi:predicted HTH transcriptional regulator
VPSIQELQPLVTEPREALDAEYKGWLDLTTVEHKAVLAKAAIAIANHGGGYIIVGLEDQGHQLAGSPRPANVPEVSQDAVNAAIHRFATPEFHCEVYNVPSPASGVVHPVIVVPGNITEPIMSKRECQGVIAPSTTITFAIMRVSTTSHQPTSTSAERRPSSPNDTASSLLPSQHVACSTDCRPLKL